ncbi:MAG TPA: FecR family protein [Prolixibacteraceae bacterium]|nr:FecR family protein [Prolixibacteraceae bacterium]HPS12017.1 FecR family protein [Prolixibacteraceae bacterium]
MFRHSDLNKQQGVKDFNFDNEINQSIRYFKVPAVKDKSDVLDFLLKEIIGLKIIKPEKNRARRLYVAIGSIASAACLLLFLLYFAYSDVTYTGVVGKNTTVYLPDKSKVILTSDSQIKFPKLFLTRSVSLRGEAYFEVEKGSKFSVKTPNGEVNVLGTRFSVSDNEDGFVVYCFEGRVGVKYREEERQLFAGDQFMRGNKLSEPSSVEAATNSRIAYFDEDFQNRSLNEIWPIVENHFGVKITSKISGDRKFTGSIHSDNVKEVVEIICTSLDLSYTQVNETEIMVSK